MVPQNPTTSPPENSPQNTTSKDIVKLGEKASETMKNPKTPEQETIQKKAGIVGNIMKYFQPDNEKEIQNIPKGEQAFYNAFDIPENNYLSDQNGNNTEYQTTYDFITGKGVFKLSYAYSLWLIRDTGRKQYFINVVQDFFNDGKITAEDNDEIKRVGEILRPKNTQLRETTKIGELKKNIHLFIGDNEHGHTLPDNLKQLQNMETHLLLANNDQRKALKIMQALHNGDKSLEIVTTLFHSISHKIIDEPHFNYVENNILDNPKLSQFIAPEHFALQNYSNNGLKGEEAFLEDFHANTTIQTAMKASFAIVENAPHHILNTQDIKKLKNHLQVMAQSVHMSEGLIPQEITVENISNFLKNLKTHDNLLVHENIESNEPEKIDTYLSTYTINNPLKRTEIEFYVIQQLLKKIKTANPEDKIKLKKIYSQGIENISGAPEALKDFMVIDFYKSLQNINDTNNWYDVFDENLEGRKKEKTEYLIKNKENFLEKGVIIIIEGKKIKIKTIQAIEEGFTNGVIPSEKVLSQYLHYLSHNKKDIHSLIDTLPHNSLVPFQTALNNIKGDDHNENILGDIQGQLQKHIKEEEELHKSIDAMIEMLDAKKFNLQLYQEFILGINKEHTHHSGKENNKGHEDEKHKTETLQLLEKLLLSDLLPEKQKNEVNTLIEKMKNKEFNHNESEAINKSVSNIVNKTNLVTETFNKKLSKEDIVQINKYKNTNNIVELEKFLKEKLLSEKEIKIIITTDKYIGTTLKDITHLVDNTPHSGEKRTEKQEKKSQILVGKMNVGTAVGNLEISQLYNSAQKEGTKLGEKGKEFANNTTTFAKEALELVKKYPENSKLTSALEQYKEQLKHSDSLSKEEKELLEELETYESQISTSKPQFNNINTDVFNDGTVVEKDGKNYSYYNNDGNVGLISHVRNPNGTFSTLMYSDEGKSLELDILASEKSFIENGSENAVENIYNFYNFFEHAGLHKIGTNKEAILTSYGKIDIPITGNMNPEQLLKFSNYILQILYGKDSKPSRNSHLLLALNELKNFSEHDKVFIKEGHGLQGEDKLTYVLRESGCIGSFSGGGHTKMKNFSEGKGAIEGMKNMKRKKIETRILTILEYIHHPIAPKLKEHLDIFSVHELSQLLAFLETGEFNSIQQFFEEQIQEYKVIGQELKIKKSLSHFQKQKTEEEKERDGEEKELQKILDD